MTKAIFWDNDGVLVETEHLYYEATRQVLHSVGIELTVDQYIEWFLMQGRGAWHLVEARGASPDDVVRLRNARNELYSSWLRESPRPIPGIADVLAWLHGRYTMGVVTSSRRDHFDLIHHGTGLIQYFDFVLTSGDYARTKPEPDPYLRAVELSGVEPEACVAIEDSERGLRSAMRAGIRCIIVPSRLTRGCRFEGAHRVVSAVAEIPAAL